jgi:glycosyltransferase involved in cell wall biosynthesis
VSFRPEDRLGVMREALRMYRQRHPAAGFMWLGFPDKELPAAQGFVRDWPKQERDSLLLLGNLQHDEFLTLLSRCFAYVRTPECDGVAASVLESLALGVPVVASENGRRPEGVITYRDEDPKDMCEKLLFITEHHQQIKQNLTQHESADNVGLMADWLCGSSQALTSSVLSAHPQG